MYKGIKIILNDDKQDFDGKGIIAFSFKMKHSIKLDVCFNCFQMRGFLLTM